MSNKKKKPNNIDVLAAMNEKIPKLSPEDLKNITLAQWTDRWLTQYCSSVKKSTLASYKSAVDNHIVRVFRDKKLIDVTDDDVQMFVLSMEQGVGLDEELKAKTIKNIHGVLHKCLQTAFELKMIPYNPAKHTKLPRTNKTVIYPLDNAQIEMFLKAILGHRFETIYKLALFTGMRQGEIIGLTKDCINFDEGYIRLYRQLCFDKKRKVYYLDSLKNSRPRVIYPTEAVMEMMKSYMKKNPSSSKFVFVGDKREHLTHPAVRNAYKKIMSRIGYPDFRFHDLRHTYAVLSLKAGVDVKTLSEAMGHHSVSFTLDTYAFVLTEMKLESARRLQLYIEKMNYKI